MRAGYQISVDIVAHRANLAGAIPQLPVIVVHEVLPEDGEGWEKRVYQVLFRGTARTEYGWGDERAHARGRRCGAEVWVFTESAIAYRDDDGWHEAS